MVKLVAFLSCPCTHSNKLIHYRQSLPAVADVTAENHEEFQKADKIVVIAYLTSPTDDPAAEFKATAEKHRDDFLFGVTADPEAITAARVNPPAIVIYRRFDEPRIDYPYPVASSKVADIEQWIKDLSVPLVDEVSGENYAVYAQSGKPLAYLFLDPSHEKKEEYINSLRPIAEQYKGKIHLVWIDAIKFGDHAKALNLQEIKWPSFVVHDLEKQLKYPYDQSLEVTSEGVADWVRQYLDGKLVPQLKSQAVPASQDDNVYTVVGKNFEEVVFDDSKDVFLELYATWYVVRLWRCGDDPIRSRQVWPLQALEAYLGQPRRSLRRCPGSCSHVRVLLSSRSYAICSYSPHFTAQRWILQRMTCQPPCLSASQASLP